MKTRSFLPTSETDVKQPRNTFEEKQVNPYLLGPESSSDPLPQPLNTEHSAAPEPHQVHLCGPCSSELSDYELQR